MMVRANGTFKVQMAPRVTEAPPLARLSLEKKCQGDLEAVSKGEMLAMSTPEGGSADYVAMKRVTGKLREQRGTFAL